MMASNRWMLARRTCARKSGVVSMTMLASSELIRMEGRRRVSRGSAERQTSQEQPMVGTPELVPEPRTLILRAISTLGRGVKFQFTRSAEKAFKVLDIARREHSGIVNTGGGFGLFGFLRVESSVAFETEDEVKPGFHHFRRNRAGLMGRDLGRQGEREPGAVTTFRQPSAIAHQRRDAVDHGFGDDAASCLFP